MEPIIKEKVQEKLEHFQNREVYIHLETTNGAYASHLDAQAYTVGAYIRNAAMKFHQAKIVATGEGKVFRVGLKMENGWVYAEGLTDWETLGEEKLLLAGHDREGRLMVALQLSSEPF